MLLSIGMIVKNEEKYLRDCLNGLKPLLEQVHSELIICDTGSEDASIEIAKEFTDKVYEIGWRDDFAWARDQTLTRSRGKWYMYVDADEIFQNVDDIIEFFNSGEFKNFSCATFEIKNFLNVELSRYSMFSGMRLFKREKDTRWYGKIHEHIKPVKLPAKNLNSIASHYGYVHESQEDKLAKHNRNLKPMLEIYENDPKDTRNILHLAREYAIAGQLDEHKKYLDTGLSLYEADSKEVFYHSLRHQLACYHSILVKDHAKTVESIRDYFNTTTKIWANAHVLKSMESTALQHLKKYKESAEVAVEAYNYFEQTERDELDTFILSATTIQTVAKSKIEDQIIRGYILAGDFGQAFEWAEKLGQEVPNAFTAFATEAYKNNPEDLSKIYDYILTKYSVSTPEYSNALSIIEGHINEPWRKYKLAVSLVNAGYEDFGDGYIRLQHLRKLDQENSENIHAEFEYFARTSGLSLQYFGDVVIAAIKYNADLVSIIKNLHITNTSDFLEYTLRNADDDFENVLFKYLEETNLAKTCSSVKTLRIMSGMLSILLENNEKKVLKEEGMDLTLFEAYAKVKHRLLTMTYREDIYNERMAEELIEQDGFAFYIGRAFECKDENDTAGFAQNLRLSLKILPNMKDIITRLADKLKEEEAAPQSAQEMLTKETERLKSIIYTMINTGNMAVAAQILESYIEVNPTDPEISKIREMVKAG